MTDSSPEVPALRINPTPPVDDGTTHKGVLSGSSQVSIEGPAYAGAMLEFHLAYAFWLMMGDVAEDYSIVWTWQAASFDQLVLGRAKIAGKEREITARLVREKYPELYRKLLGIAPSQITIIGDVRLYDRTDGKESTWFATVQKRMRPDLPMRAGVETPLHSPVIFDWADFFIGSPQRASAVASSPETYALLEQLPSAYAGKTAREQAAERNRTYYRLAKKMRLDMGAGSSVHFEWPKADFQGIAAAYADLENAGRQKETIDQESGKRNSPAPAKPNPFASRTATGRPGATPGGASVLYQGKILRDTNPSPPVGEDPISRQARIVREHTRLFFAVVTGDWELKPAASKGAWIQLTAVGRDDTAIVKERLGPRYTQADWDEAWRKLRQEQAEEQSEAEQRREREAERKREEETQRARHREQLRADASCHLVSGPMPCSILVADSDAVFTTDSEGAITNLASVVGEANASALAAWSNAAAPLAPQLESTKPGYGDLELTRTGQASYYVVREKAEAAMRKTGRRQSPADPPPQLLPR